MVLKCQIHFVTLSFLHVFFPGEWEMVWNAGFACGRHSSSDDYFVRVIRTGEFNSSWKHEHKVMFNAVIVVDPDRTFIHVNQFFTYIPDIWVARRSIKLNYSDGIKGNYQWKLMCEDAAQVTLPSKLWACFARTS